MKTLFHKPIKWLSIVILIIPVSFVTAQEICDNGIDDDGDGLVDINDDQDCFCGDVAFNVVNADFEEFSCCPDNITFAPGNGIYCLDDGWEPAALGTSDYFNTCDFLGGTLVPAVPLPIPSGEGAVGMFSSSTYEETVGSCLDNSLINGETYSLSFYIGFNETSLYSSPLDMEVVIYGTPNCDDFPAVGFNCLDTYGEWQEMATISITGTMNNSWMLVNTSFVANINANAIAFSNGCTGDLHYHFIDDISFDGIFLNPEIGEEIIMTGDCISGVALEVPFFGGSSYQWYLNGEAIIGATSNIYLIPNADQEGEYQVLIDNGLGCSLSPPLEVIINENVLDVDGVVMDVNCLGNDDGEIELDIDSPNLPFEIDWSNGEITEDIIGLDSGPYSVTVTDSYGCIGDASFTVLDPPTVSAIMMGDCNSGVEVSVGQINSGETYQWYYNDVLIPGATTNPYLVPTDAQGEYYVIISNGINCQYSVPIDVFFNTSILNISEEISNVLCFGEETGSIDIEIDNNNGPYEYEWSNGWLGQDLSNIGIGTYSVTVSDDYGCSGTATYNIIEPTELFNFANVTQPSGGAGGEATIVSNGGVQPYTYAWSNGNETATDTDLSPGVYTVIITDANGCEDIVIFNIEGDFIVIETVNPAGCFNDCNGSVSLMIDGPPVNYVISWEDPQYSGFDLSELCAGEYAYTVVDEDGAEFSGVSIITQNDSIEIEAIYIDSLCSNLDSILITTDVNGGAAPYAYLWNTNSVNDSLFDATIGNYALTVTDTNLCSDSIQIDIYQFMEPSIVANITPAGCDGEATGAIDLMIVNGVEPISYLWDDGSVSQDLSSLTQGSYVVEVQDGNGCVYIETFIVDANTGFVVTESIINVSCPNQEDGIIILDIQNGIEPYTIDWSHGPSSSTVNNLAEGMYSVVISDASGCSASFDYEIELLSFISVEATIENNLCVDVSNGSISLTIDADGNDYSLEWDDNSIEEDRGNLEPGIYELEIIDEFGCIYNYEYEVMDLGEVITSEFVIVEDTCGSGGVGSILINTISGNIPFTYLWEDNSIDDQLQNLNAGTYSLSISDANGCQVIEQITVNSISDLEVVVITTPIICAGSSTATASLQPIGGVAPYTYIWSDDSNMSTLTGLSADEFYAYTVTDNQGCVGIGNLVFEDSLLSLQIIETIISPSCIGDLGNISLTVFGGQGPYNYLWTNNETTASVDVLSGFYDVVVTDALGCTAIATYNITEPDPLSLFTNDIVNPSASNDDGSIDIGISGGTPPYDILWSTGEMSNSINGLGEGDYFVTVTDFNGCTDSLDFSLSSDISLSATYNIYNNPCYGDCQGVIEVAVVGGITPYSFFWSDGTSLDSLADLCNGDYQLEIIDANGTSIQSGTLTISSPDDLLIDGVVYDISCLDAQDGAITLNVLGGTSPYEFSWNNNAEGDSISNLSDGNYEVITIDNNGCTETAEFTIDDIPLIDVESEILDVECGDETYTLQLVAENNLNYPFVLNGEVISLNENNQLQGLTTGQYALSYLINENCEIPIEDFSLFSIQEYQLSISTQTVEVNGLDTVNIFLEILSEQNLMNYTVHWLSANSYNCISFSDIGECIAIDLIVETEEELLVLFTDQYGCETYLSVDVELQAITPEIYFPNIFSPNGDGTNDEFVIQSNDDQAELNALYIYDRWGNLIYSEQEILLSQSKFWDGNYNGNSVNPGVYIYVAEVEINGIVESYFGDVTLVY